MLNNSEKMLSWFMESLEIETSLQHLSRYHEQWSTSIQGSGYASFHLVLEEDCHFHFLEQQDYIHLYQGDAVFLLRDLPFIITDASQRTAPSLQQLNRNLANTKSGTVLNCSTHLACGFFSFRSKLSELFLEALPSYIVLRQNDHTLIECFHIFELIRNEVKQAKQPEKNTASEILIERLTSILFFYLMRHILNNPNNKQIKLWQLFNDAVLYPLILEIISRPEHDWSLTEMAERCNISRATFSKYFTDVAGFSATKFLLYYRIQIAQKLLNQGVSLQNCAEQVGYQSISAFTRAFQRVTEKNPSAFMQKV